jgi:hypothetical protein
MKKSYFCLLLLSVCILFNSLPQARAGSYYTTDLSIFLGGKVHIRFDHLLLAWTKSQDFIDRIRYEITCLQGEAVLTNVDYEDDALFSTQSLRWQQSEKPLHWDFSERFNRLDGHHQISIKHTALVKIAPYSLDGARVRFHIRALRRKYVVVWAPKTNKIYATWKSE